MSPVVQASPSSQEAVLFRWTHPVAGTQESVVQTFPSLQFVGPPGWQRPPQHTSQVLQDWPSSHEAVLFEWTHPVAGTQESVVQTFPSLQFVGPPLHDALPI